MGGFGNLGVDDLLPGCVQERGEGGLEAPLPELLLQGGERGLDRNGLGAGGDGALGGEDLFAGGHGLLVLLEERSL